MFYFFFFQGSNATAVVQAVSVESLREDGKWLCRQTEQLKPNITVMLVLIAGSWSLKALAMAAGFQFEVIHT